MAAIASHQDFEAKFRAHIADIKTLGISTYTESSSRLRTLIQSGILRHTDIRDNPERFMTAHRCLAELTTALGPAFWMRFTVHFNVFAGNLVALGTPEQVALLDKFQSEGKLGCFGLTEVYAGVNSGKVVNTTATWHPEKQQFLLNCPDKGAYKKWISQAWCADLGVVVADLKVDGKFFGPHAFLMELRRGGQLVDGVEMGDMGRKTFGNDLDNAWISFQNVWLPKGALLSRYAFIDENNQYVQRQKGIRIMDMLGQRLYTGRTVIAGSAVVFTRMLYAGAKAYTDAKKCWAPKGAHIILSDLPQLKTLYKLADAETSRMDVFVSEVERRVSDCLRTEQIPPDELVQAIAVAKVKSIELAISLCSRLKQEVGSFALMSGSGFEQMDFLQVCKFAEGDSRLLMQKMSRDRIQAFQKGFEGVAQEAQLCRDILESGKKGDAEKDWLQMYTLAEAVMHRTIEAVCPSAKL